MRRRPNRGRRDARPRGDTFIVTRRLTASGNVAFSAFDCLYLACQVIGGKSGWVQGITHAAARFGNAITAFWMRPDRTFAADATAARSKEASAIA